MNAALADSAISTGKMADDLVVANGAIRNIFTAAANMPATGFALKTDPAAIAAQAQAIQGLNYQLSDLAQMQATIQNPGTPAIFSPDLPLMISDTAKQLGSFTKANGEAARSASEAVAAAKQQTRDFESFARTLYGFRTPTEEAAAALTDLKASYAEFGGMFAEGSEEIKLYNRALEELTAKTTEAANASQAAARIFENSMDNAFGSIIDGAVSASEAFGNMLEEMLADIAKFLISRQVQSLANIFASSFGGTPYLNTPVAPGPQAANVSGAPSPTSIAMPGLSTPVYNVPRAATIPSNYGASGGGGGDGLQVVINNNAAGVGVTAQEDRTADGQKMLKILVEREVKNMVGRGRLDSTMATSYGLRRRPT